MEQIGLGRFKNDIETTFGLCKKGDFIKVYFYSCFDDYNCGWIRLQPDEVEMMEDGFEVPDGVRVW